jgi:hypothetical protein
MSCACPCTETHQSLLPVCSETSVGDHALSIVEIRTQQPPELSDVEDDERVPKENEDKNCEFFAPSEPNVWAFHAAHVAKDE